MKKKEADINQIQFFLMFLSSDSVFFFSFSDMIEEAAKMLLFAALQLRIRDEIDTEIRWIPEIKRPHTVDNLFNSPLRQ